MTTAIGVSEATISVPSGSWVRLDDGLAGRPAALANRDRVRIVNKSTTFPIFVVRSTSASTISDVAADCDRIDPNDGLWVENLGTAVHVFAQATGGTASVRFVQYSVSALPVIPPPPPPPPPPTGAYVFAPYIDMGLTDSQNLLSIKTASGINIFSLAFLINTGNNLATWGGLAQTLPADNTANGTSILSLVNSVRAAGGDIVVSFGGANGVDIADDLASVSAIQAMYQSAVTRYNLTMLDIDIEGALVANMTRATTRAIALKNLKVANPSLKISFTLPVLPTGLTQDGVNLLNNAKTNGFDPDIVNIMAMDYGAAVDNGGQMGLNARLAAAAVKDQIATALLTSSVGITPMIGQNDVAGEVFTLADATDLVTFAKANSYVQRLSMWSVSRDNGSCAGSTFASPICSGLAQPDYQFSSIFLGTAIDLTKLFPDQTRVTTWNPGTPIINRTTIYASANAATFGNGSTDATAHIQGLLDACPAGQVVFLPAGVYKISSRLGIHSSITLRGAGAGYGAGKTQIRGVGMTDFVECIRIAGVNGWPTFSAAVNVTSNFLKGSKTFTVASTAGLSVGMIVTIDQKNPSFVLSAMTFFVRPEYGPATPDGAYRHTGQTVEITAIAGNTITVRDEAHIDFLLANAPQIYWINEQIKDAGIENLTVTGGRGGNIQFLHASRCWVSGVESDGTVTSGAADGNQIGNGNGTWGNAHVMFYGTYRCVLRDSYLHHSTVVVPGGNSYGHSQARHCSEGLMENCIVYWMNKPFTTRASGGGNVVGYSYFENAFLNTSLVFQETTLDAGHGAFSFMDLYEGNWAGQFAAEVVWGNSMWITAYRNRFSGVQLRTATNEVQLITAVHIEYANRQINVVGNVLGQAGVVSNDGKSEIYEITSAVPGVNQPCVWRLGCSGGVAGNGAGNEGVYENPNDANSVRNTLYRHGNWDYVQNVITWDATNTYHTLANSLYLTSKPAFMGTNTWPWVDPAGTTKVYTLPAKLRFDLGSPNV